MRVVRYPVPPDRPLARARARGRAGSAASLGAPRRDTMPRGARIGMAAAGGLAAGIATVLGVGALRWRRATARAVARLTAAAPAPAGDAGERFTPDRLDGVPAPVARYLAFALTPNQRLVRRARVRWAGEFRTRPGGAWRPFTAEQWYTARPPGFVWDASIRMLPLLAVRVRDSYREGAGAMRAAAAALVPVVDVRGTPEMAAGALARYLGEAVWLPTALLPGGRLAWTAVDDGTARATLTDRGVAVSVDFHFGPRGEIVGVTGERYRDVDGTGVLTPWRARVEGYERRHGVMVPRAGEVEWLLPGGPFAFWRGRLVDVAYEPAP